MKRKSKEFIVDIAMHKIKKMKKPRAIVFDEETETIVFIPGSFVININSK